MRSQSRRNADRDAATWSAGSRTVSTRRTSTSVTADVTQSRSASSSRTAWLLSGSLDVPLGQRTRVDVLHQSPRSSARISSDLGVPGSGRAGAAGPGGTVDRRVTQPSARPVATSRVVSSPGGSRRARSHGTGCSAGPARRSAPPARSGGRPRAAPPQGSSDRRRSGSPRRSHTADTGDARGRPARVSSPVDRHRSSSGSTSSSPAPPSSSNGQPQLSSWRWQRGQRCRSQPRWWKPPGSTPQSPHRPPPGADVPSLP